MATSSGGYSSTSGASMVSSSSTKSSSSSPTYSGGYSSASGASMVSSSSPSRIVNASGGGSSSSNQNYTPAPNYSPAPKISSSSGGSSNLNYSPAPSVNYSTQQMSKAPVMASMLQSNSIKNSSPSSSLLQQAPKQTATMLQAEQVAGLYRTDTAIPSLDLSSLGKGYYNVDQLQEGSSVLQRGNRTYNMNTGTVQKFTPGRGEAYYEGQKGSWSQTGERITQRPAWYGKSQESDVARNVALSLGIESSTRTIAQPSQVSFQEKISNTESKMSEMTGKRFSSGFNDNYNQLNAIMGGGSFLIKNQATPKLESKSLTLPQTVGYDFLGAVDLAKEQSKLEFGKGLNPIYNEFGEVSGTGKVTEWKGFEKSFLSLGGQKERLINVLEAEKKIGIPTVISSTPIISQIGARYLPEYSSVDMSNFGGREKAATFIGSAYLNYKAAVATGGLVGEAVKGVKFLRPVSSGLTKFSELSIPKQMGVAVPAMLGVQQVVSKGLNVITLNKDQKQVMNKYNYNDLKYLGDQATNQKAFESGGLSQTIYSGMQNVDSPSAMRAGQKAVYQAVIEKGGSVTEAKQVSDAYRIERLNRYAGVSAAGYGISTATEMAGRGAVTKAFENSDKVFGNKNVGVLRNVPVLNKYFTKSEVEKAVENIASPVLRKLGRAEGATVIAANQIAFGGQSKSQYLPTSSKMVENPQYKPGFNIGMTKSTIPFTSIPMNTPDITYNGRSGAELVVGSLLAGEGARAFGKSIASSSINKPVKNKLLETLSYGGDWQEAMGDKLADSLTPKARVPVVLRGQGDTFKFASMTPEKGYTTTFKGSKFSVPFKTSTSMPVNIFAKTSQPIQTSQQTTTRQSVQTRSQQPIATRNNIMIRNNLPVKTNTQIMTQIKVPTNMKFMSSTRTELTTRTNIPTATKTNLPINIKTPVNIMVPITTKTNLPTRTNIPTNTELPTYTEIPTFTPKIPGLGLPFVGLGGGGGGGSGFGKFLKSSGRKNWLRKIL